MTVSYSNVEMQDTDEVYDDNSTNINVMPDFVDSSSSNFHLLPSDKEIDKGGNNAVNSLLPYDFDGESRIVNATVDMGPYEFQGPF